MTPSTTSVPRISVAIFLVMATTSACRDPVTPALKPQLQSIPAVSSSETYDDHLAELGDHVPGGFGGLYFDDSSLHLFIQDHSRANAAASVLINLGARHPSGKVLSRSDIIVHQGRFLFRDLLHWYRDFLHEARDIRMSTGDIDDRQNLMRLGVETEQDATAADAILQRLGVPSDAFEIEVVGSMVPDNATIRDHFRPIPGAAQIATLYPPADPCTIGFNVLHHQFGQAFVTASHCTPDPGSVAGDSAGQHLWGEFIAAEVMDPAFTIGGGCKSGARCRKSDAALYKYSNAANAQHGYMANTSGLTTNEANPVLTIDGSVPRLRTYKWDWTCIPGWPCGEYQGMPVYKLGRTTGKTYGTVQAICVDVYYESVTPYELGIRCAVATNYISGSGDSGGPVYILGGWWGETDAVRIAGVHFLRNPATGLRYYSRLRDVETELGANVNLECKGFRLSEPWAYTPC